MAENMQTINSPEQNEQPCQNTGTDPECPKSIQRADETERLFRQGYSCSSSVFAAFADIVGMTTEQATKVACPFGAGVGGIREVCGAVSGMTMVAGYLLENPDPSNQTCKKAVYNEVKTMCQAFEETEGSLICRELLGLKKGETLAEPAIRDEEYYRSRPCLRACRRAAQLIDQHILSRKTTTP
ncbi:MAG: C_GCAxxG_C_C family protein [Eggerthellaceae bacterium]|nr:C_GCAxxG_C_C family protein [Eggerthellaceae bacterium]